MLSQHVASCPALIELVVPRLHADAHVGEPALAAGADVHVVLAADGYTVVALSNGFRQANADGEFGDRTRTLVQATVLLHKSRWLPCYHPILREQAM